jgi:uncharacterized membrane protein YjjP (DUF1212 family)
VPADAVASDVRFLLRFAVAGHEAGYATAELEERALALSDALGLKGAQVSATPTLVELSVGPLSQQHTYTVRVRPAALDLGTVARLDDLVQDVVDGDIGADAALTRLQRIRSHPLDRAWPIVLGAYGLVALSLTPIIGGGWQDALAAAVVGLVVGAVALPLATRPRVQPIVAPLAAMVASFCGIALAHHFDVEADLVSLAALVPFLPGMTLTAGVRELATEQLQSGVANTAEALVQILGLVFGYEIGRSIAISWWGAVRETVPHTSVGLAQILAAVAAGLAFTVILRAQSRDAFLMCAASVLAIVANRVGSSLLGHQAGVFGAALLVGVVGSLVGAYLRRSPLVFLVPGVLMLVPGSLGFESALQLLAHQTVSGITAAFNTFVTAISIAYGLLIATVVLPRRFTEVGPRANGGGRAGLRRHA